MENASKALIIAGAILISILLISVGIIIMNSISDPVQQGADAAQSQAIEIFNSKFTGYIGDEIDYNTAKQLITTITSVNGTLNDANRRITYAAAGQNGVAIDSIGDLNRGNTYTIEFEDRLPAAQQGGQAGDGYYDTCIITQNQ